MSEYIGSRISLISKSDIKYVGTLHEINSENHTVALENVTSYGTEGRKGNPAEELPGSDTVYSYIVFRGSDVKELNIVAAPGAKENQAPKVPDDPAILGSQRPALPSQQQQQPPQQQNQGQFRGPPPPYPQQNPQFGYPGPPPNQFQNQPRFQGPGGPHGFPGSPGAVPGYGMGFGPPPPGYGMGYGGPPPPGHGFPHQPPPGPMHQNQQHMAFGPPGQQRPPSEMQNQQQGPPISSQGTPQPSGEQGIQAPPSQPPSSKPVEMSATPGPSDGLTGPPPPVDSKPPVSAAVAPTGQQPPTKPASKANNRVAVPLPTAAKPLQKPASGTQPAPLPLTAAQPQSIEDATQAATAAVAAAMAKLGPVNQNQPRGQTDGTDNLAQKVNQMRIQDQQRGRGRGRGGPPRGGRRESGQAHVDVPKEDYDFESANAKFNKQDLAKEAIASGSPVVSPTNGDTADPLAATNGHVNGDDATEDVVIPGKPSTEKGYDKKSSFFDNISSDLKDRVEQAQQDAGAVDGRAMRREERMKNVDTFGQGSVDQGGYRGGYRGRGRGGGGYRGGYNNNFRGAGYRGGRGGYDNRGGHDNSRGGGYRGRGGRGGNDPTFA